MTRYARWLLRNRISIIGLALVVTAVLGVYAAGLKIVIDSDKLAPQGHPYIESTNRIADTFGSKYLMLIGITPVEGDIFQPAVLERVKRITDRLEALPGVVKSTLISLSASQAKAIRGNADGFDVRPLLARTNLTQSDIRELRAALASNPVYRNTIVSSDYRTTAILVELVQRPDGFRNMVAPVRKAAEAEAGPDVQLAFGGTPVFHDRTETFAERINILFPIAILVIGLLHFEAFRTRQGMILPLVTALMAVVWGMGIMGALGQPLDIFNSPTPILILAVAAGHAVQLLKRYYEEFETLRHRGVEPKAANEEAVVHSLAAVGPVMMIAGGVAALGFFSLLVFSIPTIRSFGVFTGIGIFSAVLLEVSFIPAVRSLLSPPSERDRSLEARKRIWDRIPMWIGSQVIPAARRRTVMIGLVVVSLVCAIGIQRIVIDNDSKNYFADGLDIRNDDRILNRQLGGTNSLYIMVEGTGEDAIKDPRVLKGIESTQQFAESLPDVGKTVSIVDYLKRMNQAMHADNRAAYRLPDTRELVAQYLLLYSMSGDPDDFNAHVDSQYKAAKITILLKSGSSANVRDLVDRLEAHARNVFGGGIRISFGGDATQTLALTDTMVQGKVMNIVQIALAILVISSMAFRSITAGFIVLAPLTMALLVVFGVMGALGIPLNIPNSLISAMAVGIGADYAIYLLYRMREEIRRGVPSDEAMQQTLATAGKATLFVATAVAGGYGVLSLSIGFNVHLWLSGFIVLAMITSAWASLTLVPSLVLYLRPGFIFNSGHRRPLWHFIVLFLSGIALLLLVSRSHAEPGSPMEIMQKSFAATKVADSVGHATFTLTGKQGDSRVRKTITYTRLQANGSDNMRLVRFLAPSDIKGTASLLIEHAGGDDDMWIYLPALRKVRRLSAANKRDGFIGTDFSYGDVLGHKPEDWLHQRSKDEVVNGQSCYVVESTPRGDAVRQNTGYGRRVTWVRMDNFVAIKTEFWDGSGRPAKRIQADSVQPVGVNGRWQPMVLEAENLQSGHRTLIRFEDFKADQNIPASLFNPGGLDK